MSDAAVARIGQGRITPDKALLASSRTRREEDILGVF
jgi:hypothetical protein